MKVSVSKVRKLGMFSALTMVVGALIGIGIFFKNISVFNTTHGNPTTTLVSWTVSGLIALTAAISFSEIGTIASGKNGLSIYADKLIGPKMRNFISIFKPTIYSGILSIAISTLSVEAAFEVLWGGFYETQNILKHIWFILMLAFILYTVFLILNTLSKKFGGAFQIFSTVTKMIPIILIIIVSFLPTKFPSENSLFVTKHLSGMVHKPFNFTTVIALMPSILFAFDGFTMVMDMGDDIEDSKRKIPLAVFFGVGLVLLIYLLITCAQLFASSGLSPKIIKDATGSNFLYKLFWAMISIGGMGVLNAVMMSNIRQSQYLIEAKIFPGFKWFNKNGATKGIKSSFITFIIFIFFFTLIGVPSIFIDSDILVDVTSNVPIIVAMFIYLIIIISHLFNRLKIEKIYFKNKIPRIKRTFESKVEFKPINSFVFYTATIFAIIGLTITTGYQIVQPLINFFDETTVTFGAFKTSNILKQLTNWQLMLIHLATLLILFLICSFSYFYNKQAWKK